MAKLYFRYSVMNSGKTTALLQTAHNYEERDMRVVIVKPTIDTKGGKAIVSRLGMARDVDILLSDTDSVENLIEDDIKKNGKLACILVDEANFLRPSQVDEFFWLTINKDLPVIAYGLRTDFRIKGFPGSSRLLELAHEIQEMKTICRCGRKAILNGRRRGGKFIFEGEQVAIDGEAEIEYESLCGKCYFKESTKYLKANS